MTQAQIERQRANQLDREFTKYEVTYREVIDKALYAMSKPVADYLVKNGIRATIDNVDTLLNPKRLEAALRRMYITVGTHAANSEYTWFRQAYKEDIQREEKAFGFNPFWAKVMSDIFARIGGAKITSIFKTERSLIIKHLQTYAETPDFSLWELAKLIAGSRTENPRRWSRAKLISRTEVFTAAEIGREEATKKLGYMTAKKWLSIIDKRTRVHPRDYADHKLMNGKQVEQNAYFQVPAKGSTFTLMLYPHDPDAPAYQVCNCRCKRVNIPMRDARGRLIKI